MSGLVNKKNFYQVVKSFGFLTAIKLLLTKERTFLGFLMTQHLF